MKNVFAAVLVVLGLSLVTVSFADSLDFGNLQICHNGVGKCD